MQEFAEYARHDALGLAALVARGEVSAAELLYTAQCRADRAQPRLNALVRRMDVEAAATLRAGIPPGPFAGVPYLLKDLMQAYAGVPMSMGSAALRDYVPVQDDVLVQRLKRAGLVIFGKTNVPEWGLVAYTEPKTFGVTRNPWDITRTPGGSSGGSAAAVAARIVPAAGANDGGGSIRIPAAYCGLFGLKPSRGRVSPGPEDGEVWMGAACEHALTLSVRDSAALLDAVAGAAPGDPFEIAPRGIFLAATQAPPPRLRIAFSTASPLGTPVARACVDAVRATARLLESLGHHVEEAAPRIDGMALMHAYLMLYFGEVAAQVRELRALHPQARVTQLEPTTRALAAIGEAISAGEYMRSHHHWNDFGRALGDHFTHYDLWFTPTTADRPPLIGELAPTPSQERLLALAAQLRAGSLLRRLGIVERVAMHNLTRTPFTQLANLTGVPAMNVPLQQTDSGKPVGVQFMGRFGSETLLFALAAELEHAQPWAGREPAG
ncbi:amidase [Metallibacterium sp.]|uniref:amidase n=1 Tax=Metallibacterium sp. TaxID=2940281 RepID=UPI00261FBF11|nr:amidase [Metallibacterium sp.]